jgi:putative endonuclease
LPRHWSEAVARAHLEAQGYRVLAENYRIRDAEIDLVAQEGKIIVFVEVKQRKSSLYGSAAEAIGPYKLRRLRKAALSYLITHYGRDDLPLRFDAILLFGTAQSYRLEHLKALMV